MAIKRHKTKLNGGTYGSITISTHVYDGEPYSSMLAAGYAFQYIHTGEFVEYTRKAEYSGVNAISNVKVVKCPHARINEDGHCAYCNADGFAALVTAAADRTTTVYTELAAALAAVKPVQESRAQVHNIAHKNLRGTKPRVALSSQSPLR